MKLDDLDVSLVRTAVDIYLACAWGPRAAERVPGIDFEACTDIHSLLKRFRDEMSPTGMRRFSLRLGNPRYPFMKLILQELLVKDSFFFAVDTHDELGIQAAFPDYGEWLEIKAGNRALKERIERAWCDSHLPTFATLVAQMERDAPAPHGIQRREAPLILIADDDESIARGVESVLARNGYRTQRVVSAEAGLAAIAEEPPDLVLSDLEMGGMTGLEFATRLREDSRTASIPFILATAASVGQTHFRVIDGFLVKPFDQAVLLKFIETHLKAAEPAAGGDGSAPEGRTGTHD
jgi:CheY-like chemotaxis protein